MITEQDKKKPTPKRFSNKLMISSSSYIGKNGSNGLSATGGEKIIDFITSNLFIFHYVLIKF